MVTGALIGCTFDSLDSCSMPFLTKDSISRSERGFPLVSFERYPSKSVYEDDTEHPG